MKENEIKTRLQALDGLTLPPKSQMLRRAAVYQSSGITRLDPPAYTLPKPRPAFVRSPLAVIITLLILFGIAGGTILGADLYTYGKASAFFEEYGLSAEGLKRDELWDVYRDITTGKFELPATGQMLQSNMGITPSGPLSAGEAESLWEGWKEDQPSDPPEGILSSPHDIVRHISFTHTRFPEQIANTVRYQMRTPCFEPNIEAEKAALAASSPFRNQ